MFLSKHSGHWKQHWLYSFLLFIIVCSGLHCDKKNKTDDNTVPCYNAAKVQTAYLKAKDFVKTNEAAYASGTLETSKIGLYIDMLATQIRMEYYINTLTLGKGTRVNGPDGTNITIDDELIRNYQEALCNETNDINEKLK